jgi:hypothetical protein
VGKLILWLMGLLVAIVTMNVTVFLGLTAVFGVFAAARKMWLKIDQVRELVAGDPDELPDTDTPRRDA